MSFIAGDILIRMAADVASLRTDMENAKTTVGSAVNVMKNAAIALGGAFSAQMFVGWIRGAIDAADEMSKLASKTGIAMEDLGGLQLAFQLGGAEGEAFATSMNKLAKAAVGGSDAFDTLGIATRSADGTVRPIKDLLGEIADKFQETEDGTAKTALAMDLFGKTGAALIPVLNGGSEGLEEMDALARKLGLTMDEETGKKAEEFNDTLDLIGLSLQGVARQVAVEMLPTFTSLAGNLFDTMTEGDGLRKVADVLAASLKLLFSAGLVGVQVFSTLGTAIGAAGAAIVAVLNGEFAQAKTIVTEAAGDIKTNWGGTAETLEKVWNEAGGSTVESMGKVHGALKRLTPATDEQKEASKKAAAEAEKLKQEYDKLTASIEGKTAEMKLESQQTDKLTEGQRTALKVMLDLQTGTLKLTDEQKLHVATLLEEMLQQEKTNAETKTATEEKKKYEDGLIKVAAAQGKELEEMRKSNEKLEEQNTKLRIGEGALVDREIQLLKNQAEELRWQAAIDDGNTALVAQATALERRAELLEEGKVLKAAQDTATEWQKTADSIQQGLTDSLFRAAESGKGFFETLKDGIKGMFNNLVLKPVINAVMKPIAGGITSMLGLGSSGASAATGGAGGGMGILGGIGDLMGLGSLAGTAGLFGSGFASGLTAWAAEGSVMGLLGSGSALFSGGIASGLGTILGAAAPVLIPLALALSFLGKGGGPKSGGSSVINSAGVSLPDIRMFTPSDGDAKVAGMTGSVMQGIQSMVDLTGGTMGNFMLGLGYDMDPKGNAPYRISSFLAGDAGDVIRNTDLDFGTDSEAFERGLATEVQRLIVAGLQVSELPDSIDAIFEGIDPATASIEELNAALTAASNLGAGVSVLRDSLNALPMQNLASLSFDAAASLIGLAGGLDTLLGQLQTYVDLYYSDDEKAGLQAQSIVAALQAVGLSADGLVTREDFRALLESRDATTPEGQAQIAALLRIAGDFATLSDYLTTKETTLEEVVAGSPQTALLTEMMTPQEATAAATSSMSTGITTANTTLTDIRDRIIEIGTTSSTALEIARAAVTTATAAATAATSAASAASSAADAVSLASAAPTYATDVGATI